MELLYTFYTYAFYLSFIFFTLLSETRQIHYSKKGIILSEITPSLDEIFIFLGIIILSLIGLFTSQWQLFVILYLICLPKYIFYHLFKIGNIFFWNILDAYLSIFWSIFIIINKFHLHLKLI